MLRIECTDHGNLLIYHQRRSIPTGSLPLDRPRRLAGDVVDDAVDAFDGVDDPRRDARPRTSWGRRDQSAVMKSSVSTARMAIDVLVGPGVAHDADRLHRQEHGERLGDLAVEAGLSQLFEEDGVGLAEDLEPLGGDLAQAADGQAGAGERVPPDQALGQAQLQAQPADLVLEQVAERLDQLEAQLGGQAADVVVDA